MKLSSVFDFVGQPFMYFPRLAQRLGISTNASVLLCFIAWKTKPETDHWVYSSFAEIQQETGLTEREQTTARKQLLSKKIMEEEYRRIEHKLYFRVTGLQIEASDETSVRHIKQRDEQTLKQRAAKFVTKWEAAHLEAFGYKGVSQPAASRLVAALLSCGLSDEELLDIARAAWKQKKDTNFKWAHMAVSLEGFCNKFDQIKDEINRPSPARRPFGSDLVSRSAGTLNENATDFSCYVCPAPKAR